MIGWTAFLVLLVVVVFDELGRQRAAKRYVEQYKRDRARR
jgi:hypothetical protein